MGTKSAMTPAQRQSAIDYFEEMSRAMQRVDCTAVQAYADLVFDAWRSDRTVFVFGNGGSAYTASHHVTDYVKTAAVPGRRRLRAICLVDNVGLVTALGNDMGYEQTFVYQLQTYAKPGDMAVAISCSGTSPNVVAAARWAKAHGLTLAAITGRSDGSGGELGPLADVHMNVPSDNYGVIEDVSMCIGHIAAQALQRRVAAEAGG